MRIVHFTHSLRSCWNHGNAHFLRGILGELARMGHEVRACERRHNWSFDNRAQEEALAEHADFGPQQVEICLYDTIEDASEEAASADLVIVHEWNEPSLVASLGSLRKNGSHFRLFFHDTHHRAVSDPAAIHAFDLDGYDGVLAFGEALADVYRRWGWGKHVFTWHEAADTTLFHPPATEGPRAGLVWIGNWGDGERSEELRDFLLEPARAAGLPLDIHGVRYPQEALDLLKNYGAHYRGWLPNAQTPHIFARHLATVHVPRRFYVTHLPGIPTIRVFEALACGIPLVCAPWNDAEHLFRKGQDYLSASTGPEMADHLRALRNDPGLRAALVQSGLQTILERHTCAHRARELMAILERENVAA